MTILNDENDAAMIYDNVCFENKGMNYIIVSKGQFKKAKRPLMQKLLKIKRLMLRECRIKIEVK
jgi:hypothetical protein